MAYEGSTYFQKVWGRPQNFGNHRGGSEILGAVVRTPAAWSARRPGDPDLCTPVCERFCVLLTDPEGILRCGHSFC